jgi:hypothetical protein
LMRYLDILPILLVGSLAILLSVRVLCISDVFCKYFSQFVAYSFILLACCSHSRSFLILIWPKLPNSFSFTNFNFDVSEKKLCWNYNSVVERFPSMYKVLGSIPSTGKKKERKKSPKLHRFSPIFFPIEVTSFWISVNFYGRCRCVSRLIYVCVFR